MNKVNNNINQSIIKTLAFFDLYNYPLTSFELYKYLWKINKKISFAEFNNFLDNSTEEFFCYKNGYIYLPGKEKIINFREERVYYQEKKIDIAIKNLKIICYIPFIKSVYICNTVSSATANSKSDIDLFIVTENNRVWITRMILSVFLLLKRIRTSKQGLADKICLSFFVSKNKQCLENIAIKDDVYLIYWIANLIPIYKKDNNNCFEKNIWIKNYLPNIKEKISNFDWIIKSNNYHKYFKKSLNIFPKSFLDFLDDKFFKIQLFYRMKKKLPLPNNSDVILSKNIIKLHHPDKRIFVKKAWIKKYE